MLKNIKFILLTDVNVNVKIIVDTLLLRQEKSDVSESIWEISFDLFFVIREIRKCLT